MSLSSRRTFLSASASLAAASIASFATRSFLLSRKIPPNVLLIVADAFRADRIARTVNSVTVAPNLTALAENSTAFDSCYSPSSWTKPSMASIFTGSPQPLHGVVSTTETIPHAYPTIARILKNAGYRTLAVQTNPWLAPEPPSPGSPNPPDYGFQSGFDNYSYLKPGRADARLGIPYHSAASLTRHALSLLAPRREPFFLYVHYMDTHQPWTTSRPNRHTGAFTRTSPSQSPEDIHAENRNTVAHCLANFRSGAVKEPHKSRMIGVYDEAAAYLDENIGRLLQALRDLGRLDNTIIIFTADHGEALWEHDDLGHNHDLREAKIRVPLLIKTPTLAPALVHSRTTNVNILSTLLDLLEIPAPPDDLTLSLVGPSRNPSWPGEIVLAQLHDWFQKTWTESKLISTDSLSLTLRTSSDGAPLKREAYDLASDPLEEKPLPTQYADSLQDALVRFEDRLQKLARLRSLTPAATAIGWQRGFADRYTAPDSDLTPEELEVRQRLKALGYIN